MKRFLTILFTTAIFISSTYAQSAKRYYKAGEDYLVARKYEEAITQFTNALLLDEDMEKAYLGRATAHEELNNYVLAAEDYEKLIGLQRKKDEVIFCKAGRAFFKSGNPGKALARLNQALTIKEKYLEALQTRVQVYIQLERYDQALDDCKKALDMQQSSYNYYNLGLVYDKLDLLDEAEQAYQNAVNRNSNIEEPLIALADLSYRKEKYDLAMSTVNRLLGISPKHREGLVLRSKINAAQNALSQAINDISTALSIYVNDPELHVIRGDYFIRMTRYTDAILDYTFAIESEKASPEVYKKRGDAYQVAREIQNAEDDYEKYISLVGDDPEAEESLAEVRNRIYEMHREANKPELSIITPASGQEGTLRIPDGVTVISLGGHIKEESEIISLLVNGQKIMPEASSNGYDFITSLRVADTDIITVELEDLYNNKSKYIYSLKRTETNKPEIEILDPYAGTGTELVLDNSDPYLFLQGVINDQSQIKSIFIDDIKAAYNPDAINPTFSARVDILNKTGITIRAEDIYGNSITRNYNIRREIIDMNVNPMGKTWVIFVENADYEHLPKLNGPKQDYITMRTALQKYDIHNFIRKQNMTRDEMQTYFSIELRDQLLKSNVNSVLIWYAGHGKKLHETAYWIPVDAKRDDEASFYSTNHLKVSLETYKSITHLLVVTDACESGPTFYMAMRDAMGERRCDDQQATRFKSTQVLTSAGKELAQDDSQFTQTFANALKYSNDECIPIETIVKRVSDAVQNNTAQKPVFGVIPGLGHENGTFFFIPK